MVQRINDLRSARMLFCIASVCTCIPSVADNSMSFDAVSTLNRVGRETDFFRLPNHLGKTFSTPTYDPSDPSTIAVQTVTPEGTKAVYTCGAMLDKNERLRHVPALDSVVLSKQIPSGGALSFSIRAVPKGSAVSDHRELPGHIVTELSVGNGEIFFQLTHVSALEPSEAQACSSRLQGAAKNCQPIEPYLVGGTPIRQMAQVIDSCQAFLDGHKISGMPFATIGNAKTAHAFAKRIQAYVLNFPSLPTTQP